MNMMDFSKGMAAATMVLIVSNFFAPDEKKFVPSTNPKEPLICGLRMDVQHYVTEYRIDNQFVIDELSGGIWNVWHCRAYRGELPPDEVYDE